MLATINTDAGHAPRYNVGSYAYWIKTTTVRIQMSGILRGHIADSMEAEIKCIGNALAHLLGANGVPGISRIIINTDCTGAILAIRNHYKKAPDTPARQAAQLIAGMIDNAGIPIQFRHVKAHVWKPDNHLAQSARHYVNDWCDQRCTERLEEAVNEKINEARARARERFNNKYKKHNNVKSIRSREPRP